MSPAPNLLLAAFHWIEYLGLLGGIGSIVVRRLGRQPPRIAWARPHMEIAFAAATAGGLGVTLLAPSATAAARVAVELLVWVCCVRGIRVVTPLALLGAVLLAPAGHAAHASDLVPGAVYLDALHVLSAAAWAGGILALASLRPPGGWTAPEARALLERFAPVALIAFGVTALTGVLRALEALTDVTHLWTTGYGLVLVLKTAGVLVMLGLSLMWRRGWPASRFEAVAAMAITGATALLASFPLPVN